MLLREAEKHARAEGGSLACFSAARRSMAPGRSSWFAGVLKDREELLCDGRGGNLAETVTGEGAKHGRADDRVVGRHLAVAGGAE